MSISYINQYSLTSYQENLMTLNILINEPFILERGFMRSDQSALPLAKRATYDDRRNSKVLVRQL